MVRAHGSSASDTDTCPVPELDAWPKDRALMLKLLQQHLERVRVCMKNQADKKRYDRVFTPGDSVFMKLQPYIQSSVAPRAHHQLLFKYYGPFKVLERVGDSAYRLQLPINSRIHPVLHVLQLKEALGPNCQVQTELPPSNSLLAVPFCVLQRRFRQDGTVLCLKDSMVGTNRSLGDMGGLGRAQAALSSSSSMGSSWFSRKGKC